VRVLVVEDDDGVRAVLAEVIGDRGHEVVAIGRGDEAWQAYQQSPFPLLIVDWMLPGEFDGLELCRRVRASPDGNRTAILAITARTRLEDLEQLLTAGADDYLAKPFELAALEVRLAIAERYARHRAESAAAVEEAKWRAAVLAEAEKLGALGQMAGGIAHDLNQVLGLIAGYSELARQELERPEPGREALREALAVIGQAATEGGEQIARLLTFTRRRDPGEPAPIEVGSLLGEVVQLTAPRWRDASQAQGRPIHLRVDAEPGLTIRGWRPALRLALTNLVLNAVDAMPQGGTVDLRARRGDDAVVMEVVDSGAGMPPDVREHAFEPFFSTKGEQGTGLGLAQVRTTVEQHGGAVEVESTPGHGTTLRLILPSRPAADATAEPAARRQRPSVRPLRILLAEDDPRLADMTSLMLRRQGHRVTAAASGEEALVRLRAERFDALVTDLGLGQGMNGWELARQARQGWPRTRIVLVTGWGRGIDPAAARAAGVQAVLAKPFLGEDLARALAGDPPVDMPA
jgi:signal transduction histidine kinase